MFNGKKGVDRPVQKYLEVKLRSHIVDTLMGVSQPFGSYTYSDKNTPEAKGGHYVPE